MSIRYGIKYGDFEECPRCFAVVHSDKFDMHIDWHQYVTDEFHAYRENKSDNWRGRCGHLARGNYGDGMYCGLPPEHHHHQPLPLTREEIGDKQFCNGDLAQDPAGLIYVFYTDSGWLMIAGQDNRVIGYLPEETFEEQGWKRFYMRVMYDGDGRPVPPYQGKR